MHCKQDPSKHISGESTFQCQSALCFHTSETHTGSKWCKGTKTYWRCLDCNKATKRTNSALQRLPLEITELYQKFNAEKKREFGKRTLEMLPEDIPAALTHFVEEVFCVVIAFLDALDRAGRVCCIPGALARFIYC